jgi:hypothetical protein
MVISILAVVILYIFNYRMKKDKQLIERKNSEMKKAESASSKRRSAR